MEHGTSGGMTVRSESTASRHFPDDPIALARRNASLFLSFLFYDPLIPRTEREQSTQRRSAVMLSGLRNLSAGLALLSALGVGEK